VSWIFRYWSNNLHGSKPAVFVLGIKLAVRLKSDLEISASSSKIHRLIPDVVNWILKCGQELSHSSFDLEYFLGLAFWIATFRLLVASFILFLFLKRKLNAANSAAMQQLWFYLVPTYCGAQLPFWFGKGVHLGDTGRSHGLKWGRRLQLYQECFNFRNIQIKSWRRSLKHYCSRFLPMECFIGIFGSLADRFNCWRKAGGGINPLWTDIY